MFENNIYKENDYCALPFIDSFTDWWDDKKKKKNREIPFFFLIDWWNFGAIRCGHIIYWQRNL